MTILGMPTSMFLIFAATILAGSLGAIHYVVVHVILGRPFGDEAAAAQRAADRAAGRTPDPAPGSPPRRGGADRG